MSGDERESSAALSAAVVKREDEHFVVLPCAPSEFGGFIAGLLGKSQVLNGVVEGIFDVGYREIENIFHLVNSRVKEQNGGVLSHFSIIVHYSNGTSITHNSVENFRTYSPVESCFPFEVVLNFIYLIKFPGSTAPEKQEIEVAVVAESDRLRRNDRHYMDGAFEYEVHYTNRTWATDIGSLLKNHGETFVERTSKIKRFMRRYQDTIAESVFSLVMMSVVIAWAFVAFGVAENLPGGSLQGADIYNIFHFLVGSVAVMLVLCIFLRLLSKLSEYHGYLFLDSFIVLVESDAKRRVKIRSRSRWKWFSVFGMWAIGIVAGLVANYINHAGYFLPG